ncbi:MAG: acyltransferase [Actinomycetota bacterium]|nr:acyltransferase [Actinomycetota bacterium]
MTLEGLASRTPAGRDRYVDFLRAFSICTVVLGHWFIALLWWRNETIGVHNVVGVTSGLWLATWVLQVMPLFFFVGGFSNLKTFNAARRKGEAYAQWLRNRAARLLKPTVIFAAVWLALQILLHVAGVGGNGLFRLSKLPFGPLWFLLVYLAVVALTPVMLDAHRRSSVVTLVAITGAIVVVDVLRFGVALDGVGWVNLALVWLFAHQLGFFYADGSLVAGGLRLHTAMAAAGFIALIVLTNIGTYPRSMVGTDVERISNMNPPTVCIVALTLWLVGMAMLLRERVSGWLAKKRPWMAVIAANSMIMTVYLWHLTAYLIAILLLYPIGLGHPTDSTASWWLQRPIWIAVPAAILGALVWMFGRFERPKRKDAARSAPERAAAGA